MPSRDHSPFHMTYVTFRNLVHNYGPSTLTMYVPADPVLYIDKIVQLCTQPRHHHAHNTNNNSNNNNTNSKEQSEESGSNDDSSDDSPVSDKEKDSSVPWRSLFILVPMRLGVDKINPMYPAVLL